MSASPVALANEKIPFPVACRWLDIDVPGEVTEAGIKVFCPFGEIAHEDGGAARALNVHMTWGYCFAEQEHFTPVKLCALAWDCTAEEAARQMLERAGIADPDYRQQWQRLVDYRQPPDLDSLARSLRTYCAVVCPGWRSRQYDGPVAGKLADCLRLLALVRTESDCRAWLAGCKKAMEQVLGEGARQ